LLSWFIHPQRRRQWPTAFCDCSGYVMQIEALSCPPVRGTLLERIADMCAANGE
jgi:hypothetical protein